MKYQLTIALFALSLASSGAQAAGVKNVVLSKDHLRVIAPDPTDLLYRRPTQNSGLKTLSSNFGTKYPDGLYFCCYGGTIGGADSPSGEISQAIQFTARSSFRIKDIQVGLGYISGTNRAHVGLYSDAGGVPGIELQGADVSDLGDFGTCCGTGDDPDPIDYPACKGCNYWVVVTANVQAKNPGQEDSDTEMAWNLNTTEQVNAATEAYNTGSGWVAFSGMPALSFEVLGTKK